MDRRKLQAKPQRREPKPGEWMRPEEFEDVVRLTPLVAIDLLVRSPDGRVLLGRRVNEPAKGVLFVPGGRISKNESLKAAFRRVSREELGKQHSMGNARFLGVHEHFYRTNRFAKKGFGTHYITLAYELELDLAIEDLPNDQHGEYVWMTPAQLLRSREVHLNTKAYFSRRR
jgi:colanic acid biosynthesis protein WcaH